MLKGPSYFCLSIPSPKIKKFKFKIKWGHLGIWAYPQRLIGHREGTGKIRSTFIFITLHIDDSNVLILIKDNLGIGTVYLKGNTCTFLFILFSFKLKF